MVNDITTLNGSLSQLGETLATNITAKGVSASASDGLTTLANKVLQITGDTPTPTTVLFEDKCITDNTSQYVNNIKINNSNLTINLSFDSSTNGYLFNGSGGDNFGGKAIPITFQDKIEISADVKILGTSAYNQFFIGLANSLTPNQFDFFRVRGDNRCDYVQNNSDTSVKTGLSIYNNWVTLKVTIDGTSLLGKLYDSNDNLVAQTLQITNTYTNPYIWFGLNCNGTHSKNVKNIKVQTIGGGGSDCSQYQQQISDAIEYINGDGT